MSIYPLLCLIDVSSSRAAAAHLAFSQQLIAELHRITSQRPLSSKLRSSTRASRKHGMLAYASV